jgi:hypothetical protein
MGGDALQREIHRNDITHPWTEIQPESYDWGTLLLRGDKDAFVVRVKTILSSETLKRVSERVIASAVSGRFSIPAVGFVLKCNEISVSEKSIPRYETRLLFLFQNSLDCQVASIQSFLQELLTTKNKPYVTFEYLESFLTRRKLVLGDIDASSALEVLTRYCREKRACSSLFLRLSSNYPDECLSFLQEQCLINKDMALHNFGERSVHKLAMTIVAQEGKKGSLKRAMSILEVAIEPIRWGYVALNTLMRLAEEEDEIALKEDSTCVSQVSQLLNLVSISDLDCLDRVALLMMADEVPLSNTDAAAEDAFHRINAICNSGKPKLSAPDHEYIINFLDPDAVSATHLLSIILRKCMDQSAFSLGWSIASSTHAISKHVFGEIVTLASKGYFATLKQSEEEAGGSGEVWFQRVKWCVERHFKYLNRYPCGLALHVCAHRRDFPHCWKWFTLMKENLSFRLTGYHTSAVLKAASFEEEPDLKKIEEVLKMTPVNEKTTFTFIPLVRMWETVSPREAAANMALWEQTEKDINAILELYKKGDIQAVTGGPENSPGAAEGQLEKVIAKLSGWCSEYTSWKRATQNGTVIPPGMKRRSSSRGGSRSRSQSKGRQASKKDESSDTKPIVAEAAGRSRAGSSDARTKFRSGSADKKDKTSRKSATSVPSKDLPDDFLMRRFSRDAVSEAKKDISASAEPVPRRSVGIIGSGRRGSSADPEKRIAIAVQLAGEGLITSLSAKSAPSSRHGSISESPFRHGSILYALSGVDPLLPSRRSSKDMMEWRPGF